MPCTIMITGAMADITVVMTTVGVTTTVMVTADQVTMAILKAGIIEAEGSAGDAVEEAGQLDAVVITVEGACTNVHITRDRIEILRHQCSGSAGEILMARAAAQGARSGTNQPRHPTSNSDSTSCD